MADRKNIKTYLKRLNMLKTWQLVILLILTLFVAASAIRLNNVGMDQRREGVQSADEAGDEDVLQQRLLSLREYSSNHMNANTGQFVLKYQYERDSQKAIQDAQAKSEQSESPNGNVYKLASEACDPHYTLYSWPYFQCILDELKKYPESSSIDDTVKFPPTELYQYNFASPLWTPDFAGWTVLVALIIGVVIITKVILTLVLSLFLRKKSPKI